AARRAAEGAAVLAIDERGEMALARAGVPFRMARPSPDTASAIESVVRTWSRVWGRLPLLDGRSFRELAEWKGVSLWWMGEAFFRDATEAPRCVRAAEAFLRLLEAEAPAEVEAVGLPPNDALLLSRACTVRGVLYHGPAAPRPRVAPRSWERRGRREAWAAAIASLGGRVRPPAPGKVVLVADPGTEAVLGGLGASVGGVVVPVPGLASAGSRRARAAAAEARRRLRELWPGLRSSPGVHESFTHRGVAFFDLAESDLAGLLLARLPAAVRLYEAAAEWLLAARPKAVLLAVRSRDDRRTLLAAAHAAGTPSLVLRPGDAEDAERADGGPQPGQVLTGEAAADPARVEAALRAAGAEPAGARDTVGAP
ncbi:MAG TPA: hypothetical protein VLI67_03725, partial [Vicinamibacteria bacterium]|nr:hypothetical protein [Vicinamibacteria bacterium]